MRNQLTLLVLLALNIFSVNNADLLESFNCGSLTAYTDDNSIVWSGDDFMGNNGDIYNVQTTNSFSPVLNTLRAFTSKKKNCYATQVTAGDRLLVRATFYNGNYDKKSSPPTFDLQFDGNFWVTVQTSSTDSIYYEVIYVVKGDYASVCVAQTKPGNIPFISTVEFRTLGSRMYSHIDENYPLYTMRRFAYASNGTIRYPDDPYDRIWNPASAGNGISQASTDGLMNGVTLTDEPPTIVMENAITPLNQTHGISLLTGFFTTETSVYLNMYFSEISQLDSNATRSFQFYLDNNPILDTPAIPPIEIYARNLTVSANTTFSLMPTNVSTLPPLINALEVFSIGDPLTNGTHRSDLVGLASLQTAFSVLQDWIGEEPCLPATYTWDWINCSSDPTPRVTALYLGSFGLLGQLPDFSSMDALETIDLHNNSLDGAIPDFLASFPNLKQLNLGSNQFSGPIPDALAKKNGLNLVVTGNSDLCASGKSCKTTTTSSPGGSRISPSSKSKKKKKNSLPIALGTIIPIFVVIWAAVAFIFIARHKKKTSAAAVAANGGTTNTTPQATPMHDAQVLIRKMFKTGMSDQYKVEQVNVEFSDQTNQQEDQENGNANNGTSYQ